jgi:hypothetical protein
VFARVRDCGLALHVVAAARTNPNLNDGAYLCDRARSWEELTCLTPHSPRARWDGVVQVRWYPIVAWRACDPTEGPSEARVGEVAVLGDSDIIKAVVRALGDATT